jgi:hypothetical protein
LVAAVALLAASASLVVGAQTDPEPRSQLGAASALIAANNFGPAVLAARVSGGADQLLGRGHRPERRLGVALCAVLALIALQRRTALRRDRVRRTSGPLAVTVTRVTPSRAPPLLPLVAL